MFNISNCGEKKAEARFRMKRAFCHFMTLILVIVCSPLTVVANEQALDVVMVLDTSGSMKANDPHQLRSQAAKLFIKLLDRKDRVSLVSFSHRAYPVTQFLSLEEQKNEQLLFRAIDKLTSTGKYTNLHDALLRGYELLTKKSTKSKGRLIILMSDGKMDLGSKSRNLRLLEKTLDELTPKLAAEAIKVHTIAFTNESYIPLLKLAAEDTGGEFILLSNEQSTHLVFENLFQRAKLPEMLPIDEDNFVVDRAINEITIVASKLKPQSFISLESPDGTEINTENYGKNVKWFSAKKYDLITITDPLPGYWLLKYTEGGNKAYVLSNINLVVESTKRRSEPNTPLHIKAYLTKNGRKITNRAILDNMRFLITVTSPEAVEIENIMVDDGSEIGSEKRDGIYGISYAFELEGAYKIEVSALGQTFDRTKNIFINVKSSTPKKPFAKLLDEKKEEKPSKIVEEEKREEPVESLPDKEQNHGEKVIPQKEDNKEQNLHQTQDQHQTPENAKDSEDIHPTENLEESVEHTSDSTTAEIEVHEEESSYFFAIVAFIIFNILLASAGGGYYYYSKRKKNNTDSGDKKAENSDEESQPAEKSEQLESTTEITSTAIDDSSKALSSLSELDLDDELSSILESLDDGKK